MAREYHRYAVVSAVAGAHVGRAKRQAANQPVAQQVHDAVLHRYLKMLPLARVIALA